MKLSFIRSGTLKEAATGSSSRGDFHGYASVHPEPAKLSPEELAKYAGHYVAWSPDGKSILASGDDEVLLDRMLADQGHDTSDLGYSHCLCPGSR
jgi:hypothetical protein